MVYLRDGHLFSEGTLQPRELPQLKSRPHPSEQRGYPFDGSRLAKVQRVEYNFSPEGMVVQRSAFLGDVSVELKLTPWAQTFSYLRPICSMGGDHGLDPLTLWSPSATTSSF